MATTPAFATGWTVTHDVEPDGQTSVAAQIRNADGHIFAVTRIDGGPVAGFFFPAKLAGDELSSRHLPTISVDERPPIPMEALQIAADNLDGFYFHLDPNWIGFRIWHGNEANALSDTLIDLLRGDALLVRFHLAMQGERTTSFDLNGSSAAISTAIGIDADFDLPKQAASTARTKLLADEIRNCNQLDGRRQIYCLNRVAACGRLAEEDVEALIQCLDN